MAISSNSALKSSASFWFSTTFIGQLLFVAFIIGVYYLSAFNGDWATWNKNLTHGYEPGKLSSNLASLSHMFFAAIITLVGCLQLIPQIRKNYPRFHRWSGRFYIFSAFLMSLSGIYLITTTGTVGDWRMQSGTIFNGLLIMLFAVQALRYALQKDFASHRKWALRLFMVVSGVWFFRVGLMLWFFIHKAPVGFDVETFTGPFLTGLAYAQSLLPLAILQVYFYAQEKAGVKGKYFFAAVLSLLTVLMGIGIFMALMGMWLPTMRGESFM